MRRGKRANGYTFVVTLDVYHADIQVSVGQREEAMLAAVRKHWCKTDDCMRNFDSEMFATSVGYAWQLECGFSVMALRDEALSPALFGNIAHEAMHIVSLLFRRFGMQLTSASEEAYAYAIGYVAKCVTREIAERRGRARK